MKVTIANKKLLTKPYTNLDKANYFKNLQFKSGNFSLDTFEKIIKNGYTITYLYKDDEFDRSGNYMTNNYLGTQFICVDVDACSINPKEFIDSIDYKPTFIHTSFSNLTEYKDNKYCYHLIYCFDDVIEGENNFDYAFKKLTNQYSEYVDNAATDCHRVIFTSNSELPNFELYKTDIIYKSKDFVLDTSKDYDELDTFFEENPDGKNKKMLSYKSSSNYKRVNEKISQPEETAKIPSNSWKLEDSFWEDLNTMHRKDFLDKYLGIYPYITSTPISEDMITETESGILYADLRNVEYYEVPSKFRYNINTGKKEIVKIKKGQRNQFLIEDAFHFMKVIPNITKEYLVTMLLNEVSKYYDNSDKELNNYKIVSIAKWCWNKEVSVEPIRRKFKILVSENMSKNKAVGLIRKLQKDDEIGNNLDLLLTVEDNIKLMKENGIKITKNRLNQFLDEYGIVLNTEKEIRNQKVIDIYKENPNRSSREIEKICKQLNINVSYKTIQGIIKKYNIGKN